ncbi:aminoglycoside phosphotransferase family protein [Nocardioides dilutus]
MSPHLEPAQIAFGLLEAWDLTPDGPPVTHEVSFVQPVVADGDPAFLKVTEVHPETEHEALALQTWGGRGAVRLLRADPRRRALLLERLESRDLLGVPVLEACEIVAGLYAKLHVAAPPQLITLPAYVAQWLPGLAALPRDAPIPHRLVDQALGLARELDEEASTGRLLHGDLHYENVLGGGERAEWLVIDPQPMSGDPHYEPAPLLWNRWDELTSEAPTVRDAIRQRLHAVVDGAELDEQRAVAWTVVRMVVDAFWSIEDAAREVRPLGPEELERITRCVVIAKAVQD